MLAMVFALVTTWLQSLLTLVTPDWYWLFVAVEVSRLVRARAEASRAVRLVQRLVLALATEVVVVRAALAPGAEQADDDGESDADDDEDDDPGALVHFASGLGRALGRGEAVDDQDGKQDHRGPAYHGAWPMIRKLCTITRIAQM